MTNKPTTIDELGSYIISEVSKTKNIVGIAWELKWGEEQRATHNAPKGCQTNWTGKAKDKDGNLLPSHYPGWYGRVWIRFGDDPDFMRLGDLLGEIGIHTGTGGGGSYNGPWDEIYSTFYRAGIKHEKRPRCYSWDCTIFDQDFPEMTNDIQTKMKNAIIAAREQHNKDYVWAQLNDKWIEDFHPAPIRHKFEWTDPEQLREDKEFIKKFTEELQNE